ATGTGTTTVPGGAEAETPGPMSMAGCNAVPAPRPTARCRPTASSIAGSTRSGSACAGTSRTATSEDVSLVPAGTLLVTTIAGLVGEGAGRNASRVIAAASAMHTGASRERRLHRNRRACARIEDYGEFA